MEGILGSKEKIKHTQEGTNKFRIQNQKRFNKAQYTPQMAAINKGYSIITQY